MQPFLKEIPRSTQIVDNFRGYNHNLRIGVNEFYDEENLSSDDAPVLSVRKPRKLLKIDDRIKLPTCVFMYPTDGGYDEKYDYFKVGIVGYALLPYNTHSFYKLCVLYRDKIYDLDSGYLHDNPPSSDRVRDAIYFSGIPAIFWNGSANFKYYRKSTDSFDSAYGWVQFDNTKHTEKNTIENCDIDGNPITIKASSEAPPDSPSNGDYWIDTSGGGAQLKKFSVSAKIWVAVPTTFIRIHCVGSYVSSGGEIEEEDGVKVEAKGFSKENTLVLNEYNIIKKIIDDSYSNTYVVTGIVKDTAPLKTDVITIIRPVPEIYFPIEASNRVWGCKIDGSMIHASALGDIKNWNKFQGQADDSYFVHIGTPGMFTGSCASRDKSYFFKEDVCHVIYGTNPPFQVKQIPVTGVQNGCSKSIAVIDDVIYYKSRMGVCAFDGTTARIISYEFGDESYGNATAVGLNGKYYINMQDKNGDFHLFVYDTRKRIWHKETGIDLYKMVADSYGVYALQGKVTRGETTTIQDSSIGVLNYIEENDQEKYEPQEGTTGWYAETGILTLEDINQKYISKITVRMKLAQGSQVTIKIRYDDAKDWTPVHTERSTRLRSFDLPIRIKRCDHMQLRFEGFGPAWIYSIAKTIQGGSELAR